MNTIQKKIRAGIAFLNVVKPNWLKKIKLNELDLSQSNTCMIGEIYGNYGDGIDSLGLTDEIADLLGFHANSIRTYTLLTKGWKDAIKKLQE